jgi:UDP-N-acetylmuramoyl-tripeptide--D-alanyl-D-alanine ligase
MLPLTIADLATILGVQLTNANGATVEVFGFAIDSRTVKAGDLFFALKGPHFDGHRFLLQAQSRCAAAAVVEQVEPGIGLPQLQVDGTLAALADTARWWRRQHRTTVISVCGSNGKTTVKNMLIALLKSLNEPGSVLGTQGNLNNHIGVPLTLFRLQPHHRVAVIEMGANHPGEIAPLADMAEPDIAIITNAGLDHLEGFGSVAGSARTNGEVFAAMDNGTAILNADDEQFPLWFEQARHLRVISFGCRSIADVFADRIEQSSSGSRFTVSYQQQRCRFELPLPGRHNIGNALAAIAALLMTGKSLARIAASMRNITPQQGRLTVRQGFNGCRLIDDSYNANPTSLQAALAYLRQCTGKKWLILGDMAELGADSARLHKEAGQQARRMGIDGLLTYGELSRHAMLGFGDGGRHFTDIDALIDYVKNAARPPDTILVKGSRSMKMEWVVNALDDQHKSA